MARGSALVLMLIEYMERCRVGFGWTGSTLVSVHVWIWMCHCVIYDTPWHAMAPSQLYTRLPPFNYNGNDILLCACIDVDWIWICIMWALDEQTVRWYIGACLNVNVSLLGFRCTMIPSQLHTRLLFNYNDNDIRPCACIDVDWIYGYVSFWLWTNRQYVNIGACLNLNVSLFVVR